MRMLIKSALSVMAILLILLLSVWNQSVTPVMEVRKMYAPIGDTLSEALSLDSLRQIIGNQKILPDGFELAGAIALSAYPELKDVAIEFRLVQGGAPMEANFDIPTLFVPWTERKYIIYLNDAVDAFFDPILLRNLPFNAQVGILAHELGHVVYYDQLDLLELGKWGLMYLMDDDFRAAHERGTDLMPVYHGLGSQIYQYAYHVRKDSSCVDFYEQNKLFIDQYYMTDEELLNVLY